MRSALSALHAVLDRLEIEDRCLGSIAELERPGIRRAIAIIERQICLEHADLARAKAEAEDAANP